jgi:prepilin-type processing-associated H-X9-DG protein
MFVEAKRQVIWSKPDDVPFDPANPLPAADKLFGGLSPNGFNAAMGDGSVRFLKYTVDPKTLKAMITRGGGEIYTLD